MSGWKWWYVGIACLFALTGLAGALLLRRAPDVGLAQVGSVEELKSRTVRLEWAQGDPVDGVPDADLSLKDLIDSERQYIEQATQADFAVLATATGKLQLTRDTIGQEIQVESIVKGEPGIAPGQTCYVWNDFGFQVIGGEIVYRNILNLMQPGTTYLVFLQDNQLNDLRSRKAYYLAADNFAYLSVPFQEFSALPTDNRTALYAQWAPYGAFLSTQEIAAQWNHIAWEILKAYQLL